MGITSPSITSKTITSDTITSLITGSVPVPPTPVTTWATYTRYYLTAANSTITLPDVEVLAGDTVQFDYLIADNTPAVNEYIVDEHSPSVAEFIRLNQTGSWGTDATFSGVKIDGDASNLPGDIGKWHRFTCDVVTDFTLTRILYSTSSAFSGKAANFLILDSSGVTKNSWAIDDNSATIVDSVAAKNGTLDTGTWTEFTGNAEVLTVGDWAFAATTNKVPCGYTSLIGGSPFFAGVGANKWILKDVDTQVELEIDHAASPGGISWPDDQSFAVLNNTTDNTTALNATFPSGTRIVVGSIT